MAYLSLSCGGTALKVVSLAVTETVSRGYEWQASVVDFTPPVTSSPMGCSLTVTDNFGNTRTFPTLRATRCEVDSQGNAQLSGIDETTSKLSQTFDVDPDSDDDTTSAFNSNRTTTVAAVCGEVFTKLGVSGSAPSVPCMGLGTLSSNGISTLDRVLGLFNYDWRIEAGGQLLSYQQQGGSAKTFLADTATRVRDFEQRKTQMAFSKVLTVPEFSDITVQNGLNSTSTTQFLTNPFSEETGYPKDEWIDPWTLARVKIKVPVTVNYYSQACSLGEDLHYIEVLSHNDTESDWHIDWYEGDPGTPENPLAGDKLGTTQGLDNFSSPSRCITHARLWRAITYQAAQNTVPVTVHEYPHWIGPAAKIRAYKTNPNGVSSHLKPFSYVYNSERTPVNPDENLVSDTLWTTKAQCQELAPGQLWANNRQSHIVNYSGPLNVSIRLGDIIACGNYPNGCCDVVTNSFSGNECQTSLQCAVLGAAQW